MRGDIMALPMSRRIELEFGGTSAGVEPVVRVTRKNLARMIQRLPTAIKQGKTQERVEICDRLLAFSETVDESRLAAPVLALMRLEALPDDELQRHLQALDALLVEWTSPQERPA